MISRIANLIYAFGFAMLVLATVLGQPRRLIEGVTSLALAVLWVAAAFALSHGRRWGWWVSIFFLTATAALLAAMLGTGLGLVPIAGDPTDGIGFAVILGSGGVLGTVPVLIGIVLQHHTLPRRARPGTPPPHLPG